MLSMTGYGKGAYDENGVELTCEIKTVNNRYLDVSIKAPRIFSALISFTTTIQVFRYRCNIENSCSR